jgi:hypothetical protein
VAQWLLLAAVLAMPALAPRAPEKPRNQGEIDKQVREMVPLPELEPIR